MVPQSFAGGYADEHGTEAIMWRFEPLAGGLFPSYEIRSTVRGVGIRGCDFDGLEPVDALAAGKAGLSVDRSGDLTSCVLSGALPCTIEGPRGVQPCLVRFTLDLRQREESAPGPAGNLRLSIEVEGATLEVADDWFEDGLLRLAAALPGGFRLRSCVTCLFADYSPGGHSLMGIRCHREGKAQYLAVRGKSDYWPVPVTEEVPETYLCGEFEPRVSGTGYRG
ncbi:DUF6304 family protein [Streptomyces sp. NPDC056661]|uniref:DUF6304 family protein n=1 Tax=Streptomyces sp. NPDC056661 TaxID=3345898 RepID=UPI0036B1F0F5